MSFVSSRTGRFYVTKNGQTSLMIFGLVRLLSHADNKQYWVTIYQDMIDSGIDEATARKISLARGYKSTEASVFVSNNKSDIGDITEEQQINIFNIIYPGYVTRTIANYNSWISGIATAKTWEQLDAPIQEVLVDFVYQGF